jgi:hypothetical protein
MTSKRPSTEPPSLRQISKQYGISRAMLWRAQQVGNIPEDQFEALIEGDDPATVTQLVEIGRKRPKMQSRATLRTLKRAWLAATPEERAQFAAWVQEPK